jgi:elongation factor P
MQFVYHDGDGCVFVDTESDDQATLPRAWAGEALLYLKEGARAHVTFLDGKPLGLELPPAVELAVTDTDPPTQVALPTRHKPATLETGLRMMIPAFVDIGETILVDPRDGTYLGRAGALA